MWDELHSSYYVPCVPSSEDRSTDHPTPHLHCTHHTLTLLTKSIEVEHTGVGDAVGEGALRGRWPCVHLWGQGTGA